jgi:hypothetical protein
VKPYFWPANPLRHALDAGHPDFSAKSETLLFAGKPGVCKKGKTRFRLFWRKNRETPPFVMLLMPGIQNGAKRR